MAAYRTQTGIRKHSSRFVGVLHVSPASNRLLISRSSTLLGDFLKIPSMSNPGGQKDRTKMSLEKGKGYYSNCCYRIIGSLGLVTGPFPNPLLYMYTDTDTNQHTLLFQELCTCPQYQRYWITSTELLKATGTYNIGD